MKAVILIITSCILTSFCQAGVFKTEKWQTSNGTQVVFYQAMDVPMLNVNLAFAAGSAYDGKNFGLSAMTTRLLDQGNGAFDANQIAEKLADTGAQYESRTSRDMVTLTLKTLTSEPALYESLEILNQIISKPNFKQNDFNREKNQQLIAIAQQQESPDELANLLFFKNLYPNHPYGHSINGEPETVQKISNWQVREFYKHYFVGRNAVLVLVGAIDSEKAHQIAEKLMQNLPSGEKAPEIPKAASLAKEENIHWNYASTQTVMRLGQVAIEHRDPDYFPIMVGNYILGGGILVSRLSNEIREKRGLTYNIVSQILPVPGEGPFIISLATKNNQAKTALQITQELLGDFLKQGVTHQELEAAKQYLIGSYPLSLSGNGNIAGMLLRMTFYHLPDDYLETYIARVEAVTPDQIQQAFNKLIDPKKLLVITVGKM